MGKKMYVNFIDDLSDITCFDCDRSVYIESMFDIIKEECEYLENGDSKEVELDYECMICGNYDTVVVDVTRYDNELEVTLV